MAVYSNIGLEEPSTITHRAATVQVNRGGVNEDQEILVIGDPESSLGQAGVLDTTPASTQFGLVVREAEPTTSVRVHQSSAGDLNVTVAGYVAPSTIQTISTGSVRVHQSSAGDLNVTVAGYVAPSTDIAISSGVVQVQPITSSGKSLSTDGVPASTEPGLIVRVADPSTGPFVISSLGGAIAAVSSVGGRVAIVPVTSTGKEMTTSATPASTEEGVIVRVADPSTGPFQISSLGGTIAAVSSLGGRVAVIPVTSTGKELTTNAAPASTEEGVIVRIADPSTGPFQISSVAGQVDINIEEIASSNNSTGHPLQGETGLRTAQIPVYSTWISGTLSSAESTIVAAASTARFAVYAVHVSLPPTSSQTVRLLRGSTDEMMRWFFHSTAVSVGSNEVTVPPHYLCATSSNQSLVLTSSGGTANVTYSVSFMRLRTAAGGL